MTSTNWLILLLFIFALCLCCSAMTSPPSTSTTYVDAYGNTYVSQTGGYNWWNPFSWYSINTPSYGIGYDGVYPSYDSTYVDGNSRGWYNAGGWYGQTARPYYGYGRGYGGRGWGYGYGRRW